MLKSSDKSTPKGDVFYEGKEPHGWIQWKGTNVCCDLYCSCGHHGHVDEEFFYEYQCPECKQVYKVGAAIKLIPIKKVIDVETVSDPKQLTQMGNRGKSD